MKRIITGLELFGLGLRDLSRLGDTRVRVHVHLRTWDVTPALVAKEPGARHEFVRVRLQRWLARLALRFPHVRFRNAYNESLATSLLARVSARDVAMLSTQPGVRATHIASVEGRSRRRTIDKSEWYCVRGRVCIQVENQERGMQTIEDRFVLVRAESFDNAKQRLAAHWREYGKPYLNNAGLLVRWHLEEVVGICATWESDLDPNGVEVYSDLFERRTTAARTWRPRTGVPARASNPALQRTRFARR